MRNSLLTDKLNREHTNTIGLSVSYEIRRDHRQSINQSIKTHFYSAICRERIRHIPIGLWDRESSEIMTKTVHYLDIN